MAMGPGLTACLDWWGSPSGRRDADDARRRPLEEKEMEFCGGMVRWEEEEGRVIGGQARRRRAAGRGKGSELRQGAVGLFRECQWKGDIVGKDHRADESGKRASGRGGNPMRGRQLQIIPLIIGLLVLVMPVAYTQTFNPAFGWMGQDLFECKPGGYGPSGISTVTCDPAYVKSASPSSAILEPYLHLPPGHHKACTSLPKRIQRADRYVCRNESNPTDIQCTCMSQCADVVTDSFTFPPLCLTTIASIEDTWTPVATYVYDEKGTGPPSTGADNLENQPGPDFIKVVVMVSYGNLDIYGTEADCTYSTEDPQVCRVEVNAMQLPVDPADRPLSIEYRNYLQRVIDTKELMFIGSYRQVVLALKALKYKANINQNSNRLRSRFYSSVSSKTQPYEIMKMNVSLATTQAGPYVHGNGLSQMIHIIDVNDGPVITDPTATYVRPSTCTDTNKDPACHFGQFFAYEDSSVIVSVQGLSIDDLDVYEGCSSGGLGTLTECNNIEVSVRANKGALSLNTISNLIRFKNLRSEQVFLGSVTASISAIKVLLYRVVLQDETNSAAENFNTQVQGQDEFITVIIRDQAFSGDAGLSEQATLRVPITVVATNDAPVITLSLDEFGFFEDKSTLMPGIVLSDIDVNEVIISSLAKLDWMDAKSNKVLLNKIMLTVSVNFGVLRFLLTRGLSLVSTKPVDIFEIAATKLFIGHNVCRLTQKIEVAAAASQFSDGVTPVGSYSKICAFENAGAADCPTGAEATCRCLFDNSCATDGAIIFFLNRTITSNFIQTMTTLVDNTDKTCGGVPTYAKGFSLGKQCTSDTDCQPDVLPPCTLGVNCSCCANITHICSSDRDCAVYDLGSPCGCMQGTESGSNGQCGPWCPETGLTTADKAKKCIITNILTLPLTANATDGTPCTYRSPAIYPGSERTVIEKCVSPTVLSLGSSFDRVLSLVGANSPGSNFISVYGAMSDVNQAVQRLAYVTIPNYNKNYRPPESQRDPATFDITADSLDQLYIKLDDMGNSGGSTRDVKMVEKRIDIRVEPVNSPPSANGPTSIVVTEDVPYHFLTDSATFGLNVTDKDSNDYGFNNVPLTVNISCLRGRLYLNETFLQQPGVSGAKVLYRDWGVGITEYRGLHRQDVTKRSNPAFGSGCQFLLQCSDGSKYRSPDKLYGFSATEQYGVVYSPRTRGEPSQGCGNCPEDTGNHFLSIQGILSDLNQALSLVTYLPDPNFNTRYGQKERITFNVSDNSAESGGSGTHTLRIDVVVESVNDRPLIGRKMKKTRQVADFTQRGLPQYTNSVDEVFLPINKTMNPLCFSIPPSGDEYWEQCGPAVREYVDIDEDTVFFIAPDILWINDVDSDEAEMIAAQNKPQPPSIIPQNRYCCAPAGDSGCRCGLPCKCGSTLCRCETPTICSSLQYGRMLVDLQVDHGLLSFYPPPGRVLFTSSELTFVTNLTKTDIRNGGTYAPCSPQISCMRNQSRITISTTKSKLQQGLEQLFLSYQGLPNYYGTDKLKVWVSDLNHTDECYNDTLANSGDIDIRVIAVNDPPTTRVPSVVLKYDKNLVCKVDFMKYPHPEAPPGLSKSCMKTNKTKVPPFDKNDGSQWMAFQDIDMGDKEYGNLTLLLVVGNNAQQHANAGNLFLMDTPANTKVGLEWFTNDEGLKTMLIQGSLQDVNEVVKSLNLDTSTGFGGYVPLVVLVNDMTNYGECSGLHLCGQAQPCSNHLDAERHTPVLPGLTVGLVDIAVGGEEQCLATDCERCNALLGCGWCSGACTSAGGKCMIGDKSGPTFETCLTSSAGLGWRMCGPSEVPLVAIAAGVTAGAVVLLLFAWWFWRWARRRHGTVAAYIRKKKDDILRNGKKLNIIPDNNANFQQFFLLIGVTVLIIIVIQLFSSSEPLCDFRDKVFLDKASFLILEVDNCQVRFIPAFSQDPPDDKIQAVKVKVALMKDALVTLETDQCSRNSTVRVINSRNASVKYDGYYCYIQVLVPDKFVMPYTIVLAKGDNVTTVRGGPMDKDSPAFGIDFGPNDLRLSGNNIVARLANLTAKNFHFNVKHGNLIAEDLQTTKSAVFESISADMTVTTRQRTSVRWWQKSQNLACLAAAPGSLYVDDSCSLQCVAKEAGARRRSAKTLRNGTGAGTARWSVEEEGMERWSFEEEGGSRRQVEPWLCTQGGKSYVGEDLWNCTHYDSALAIVEDKCPIGAKYSYKSQVPVVLGCTDLATCTLDESALCLCRPSCDMANLNPTGVCNTEGQCCQTICAGYSKADLFPTPDQPRCGLLIDPITKPWCNGTLEQQFTFTSDTGQVALQVYQARTDALVASYRGSAPALTIPTTPGMVDIDRAVLNEVFHPGGKSAPIADWFALRLRGPGTPERTFGDFVWTRSTRNLVVVPWVLDLVSLGLLKPGVADATSRLNPAFCPAMLESESALFNSRLVQMRELLIDSIRLQPGGGIKDFPEGSTVAFVPTEGLPRIFYTDPVSNEVFVSEVHPLESTLIIVIIALAFGIPICVAIGAIYYLASYFRGLLVKYRERKLLEEQMTKNLGKALRQGNEKMDVDDFLDGLDRDTIKDMEARTSFFYLTEDFFGWADKQRTVFADAAILVVQVAACLLPCIVVYIIADMFQVKYLSFRCQHRPDICFCRRENDPLNLLPLVLKILVYVYFLVCVAELAFYYLAVKLNRAMRLLRYAFYAMSLLMLGLSIFIILTVILFILLGLLIKPLKLAPYGFAIIGCVTGGVALFAKLDRFQVRVRRAVLKEMHKYKAKVKRLIPELMLEVFMQKNLESAFAKQGLGLPHVIVKVLLFEAFLILIYVFLFIGFEAFTENPDVLEGIINTVVVVLVAFAAQQAVARDGDEEGVREQVEDAERAVMQNLRRVFDLVTKQVALAKRMFEESRQQAIMSQGAFGEDYASQVYGKAVEMT